MKKIIFIIAIAAITAAGILYEPTVKNEASNDINIENAEVLAGFMIHPVTCFDEGPCDIANSPHWKTMFVGDDGTIYH